VHTPNEAQGEKGDKLCFEPFVGIAPRRYFDFFLFEPQITPRRVKIDGKRTVAAWQPQAPRFATTYDGLPLDCSYLEREEAMVQKLS
jgi:hypothetical protein